MSVETIENFLTAEDVQWFRDDFERYLLGPLPPQKTSVVKQYEVKKTEPGYNRLLECAALAMPDIVDCIDIIMSYQRQFIPHPLHVDGFPVGVDKNYYFSIVIPLQENINDVFKTIVWDKNFEQYAQFDEYQKDFALNKHNYIKLNNSSEEYNLTHCLMGGATENLSDYMPLEGAYVYKLGTAGKFVRTHVHATNNWTTVPGYEYKYKDIIFLTTNPKKWRNQ
jgi:hypothetical protein